MNNKELLFSIGKKDFDIQTFRSGGKGGQKQNKVESGVRLIHRESGARGESRTYRSQTQNKKEAFKRLIKTSKFKLWHLKKVNEMLGEKSIEEKVEESMNSSNLKIEVREKGVWTNE